MPTFSSSRLNNQIVKRLIIPFLLGIVLGPLGQAQTSIRVASYNVENYILSPIQNRPLKTKLAQAKVVESILAAKPDVLALQEVGTIKALAKLQKDLKSNPEIKLVVLGDFNDYYNSKPVKAIVGRGNSRLIDTRPSERNGDSGPNLRNSKWFPRDISWTHFYGVEDVYSRIDYIMLSPGMARELDRANSSIPVVPNWGHGSDHRPVVISVHAKDR